MNKDLNEEWFPMPEAAQYIGRSDTTVERLAASGLLESKLFPRPGMKAQRRYRKASLDSWLASRPAGPADVLTIASANRFMFQLQEGPIVVTVPGKLGRASLAIAHEFLMLTARQLLEIRNALENDMSGAQP
jgi:predicted DNA-binding transcriptional regulator AlpA